jgi:altronate dehydratase small subunit
MALSALIVNKTDNVATAVRSLESRESVRISEDTSIEITIIQPIPAGHKFALQKIQRGEPIIKYGEIIGLATQEIASGEHVHIHNVEGRKGRGDKA